jgi:hypothetical protein
MKTLENGRRKAWSKKLTCTGKGNDVVGCGAKLLVEKADLFRTESSAGWEDSYHVTFLCPECGAITDTEATPFSPHDLPHSAEWLKKNRVKLRPELRSR